MATNASALISAFTSKGEASQKSPVYFRKEDKQKFATKTHVRQRLRKKIISHRHTQTYTDMFKKQLTTAATDKHILNPIFVGPCGSVANEKKVSVGQCGSVANKKKS